jgi:hypothetical protein
MLRTRAILEHAAEDQMRRLRAKANNRSLQRELRALTDQANATPGRFTVDEIVARVSRLGLVQRAEAARLIREDRDRQGRRRVCD